MEFVDGVSLQEAQSVGGRIEPKRAAFVIKQVFEALGCAHASGVVHRDLKPTNIMLQGDDSSAIENVKIIDFGLAKLMPGYGIPGQKLTETGYALGTCHYMAPEQALGHGVDHRVDIYAAGCILYQMLAGSVPFDADNNVAIMYKHIKEMPIPLVELFPDHPMIPALSAFVQNCTAKDPADRYQLCADATRDIEAILKGNFANVTAFAVDRKPLKRRPLSSRSVVLAGAAIGAAILGYFVVSTNHVDKTPSTDLFIQSRIGTIVFDQSGANIDTVMAALHRDKEDHLLDVEQKACAARALVYATDRIPKYNKDEQLKQRLRELAKETVTKLVEQESGTSGVKALRERYEIIDVLRRLNMDTTADSLAKKALAEAEHENLFESDQIMFSSLERELQASLLRQDRFEDAEPYTKARLERALEMQNSGAVSYDSCILGDGACLAGRYKEAREYYDKSTPLRSQKGVFYVNGRRARLGMVRADLALSDLKQARIDFEVATKLEKVNEPNELSAFSLFEIALLAQSGQTARAKHLAQGLRIPTHVPSKRLFNHDISLVAKVLNQSEAADIAAIVQSKQKQ